MGWIAGNRVLSISEQRNNAKIIYNTLKSKGWSDNAICAILGNMQSESWVNPAVWESFRVEWRGFGLVQWTPYTKYSEWAGNDWQTNYDKQLDRIEYECQNGEQWFRNPEAPIIEPPITFKEFKTSTLDVVTLANYFLWYYEHPEVTIQSIRGKQAVTWYEYLIGDTPVTPDPDPDPEPDEPDEPSTPIEPPVPPSVTYKRKRLPIYMYPNRYL